jgi:hypothetical protein
LNERSAAHICDKGGTLNPHGRLLWLNNVSCRPVSVIAPHLIKNYSGRFAAFQARHFP